jgi:mannose-1-phosphate guanylyltransferase
VGVHTAEGDFCGAIPFGTVGLHTPFSEGFDQRLLVTAIDAGDRYQVKRITVKPGEGLSVQMHHHRAEHWVVVAGTAKVTIDGEIKLLGENESIYIPLGATHCLENPGKIPLDLIEVRSGSYLEEDDIVRFEDRYGRV